jgi:hypothetical protein
MRDYPILNRGEEEILATIGYLTMRWNYAEHCCRQILRRDAPGGSINDPQHPTTSKKTAFGVEQALRTDILPNWGAPGKPLLENLIEAFATARKHRNQKLHGIWMTASSGGDAPAQALLLNVQPVGGKTPAPRFVTNADLKALAIPFWELGILAQKVMVAFDSFGAQAKNEDGTFVLPVLPTLIAPLPEPVVDTF